MKRKSEDGRFFECNKSNYNLCGHQYGHPTKFFFSQRVVNISNGLPRAVDSASSVNNFKNLLADCAEWGM